MIEDANSTSAVLVVLCGTMKHVLIALALCLLLPLVMGESHPEYPGFSVPVAGDVVGSTLSVDDAAVYRQVWFSDGGSWQPLNLSGTPWFEGSSWLHNGSVGLPGTVRYLAVYSCSREVGWDCHGGWQLHVLNRGLCDGLNCSDGDALTVDTCVSGECHHQVWEPLPQPNLSQELQTAPTLNLSEAGPPPQRCWVGGPYIVPNPNGSGWDMLRMYYSGYGGSGEVVIHDFGSGETTKQAWGPKYEGDLITSHRTDFHMQPGYYIDGKLVFYIWVSGLEGLAVTFTVYDPAANEFVYTAVPNPPSEYGNAQGAATDMTRDGMVYGIGWDGGHDGYVPVSFNITSLEAKAYGTIGHPDVGSLTVNYREAVAVGDWVYAAIGNSPWHIVAYNFRTGEGKVLAETADISGDHNTIGLREVESGGERGVSGYIREARWIDGVGNCSFDEYSFWLHGGEVYERTGDDAPWSGEPAESLSFRPSWSPGHQRWPDGFVPPVIPLEDIASHPSDVTVAAADAALGVEGSGDAGWDRINDSGAFAGQALQADAALASSDSSGVARINVTFPESGNYYLYYRARTWDADGDGGVGNNDGVRFSRGDDGVTPWSSNTGRSGHAVRSEDYKWHRAWESYYGESFNYTVTSEDVGVSHEFVIKTSDPGVTMDHILFSKDPDIITDLTPVFEDDTPKPDPYGSVTVPYRFRGGDVWRSVNYTVTMYDGVVRHLREYNESVVVGTDSGYGQTVAYNVKEGVLDRVDGGLSPYSMTADPDNQKVYVSGYPNSQVYEYDMARGLGLNRSPPNPQFLGYLGNYDDGENTHCPVAGTFVGADGRIYNAGVTYGRTREGGGLNWYIPENGTTGGIYKPQFTPDRPFWGTSASDGRYILLSTKNNDDPDVDGKVSCWDTLNHEFAYEERMPAGTYTPGELTEALPGLVMGHGISADGDGGILYGLKASTGELLWVKEVPEPVVTSFASVRRHRYSFRPGPNGGIWAFQGDVLVRVDPDDAEVHVVGRLPDGYGAADLAFANNSVYIAGGGALLRIDGVNT